jgi:hypothetical protein
MKSAARVKDRVNEDPDAAAIVAVAMKRRNEKAQAEKIAKAKAKRASGSKPIHGVNNNSVHTSNASSRQVDGVDTIDRDSDMPTQWKRPSNLDAPPPRDGYIQRWVRYRSGNAEDIDNLEKAMDQGWRPVEKSTKKTGHELTARTQGQYGKYYVKRGLMLMEIPEKLAQQRNAFYRKKLRVMTESVDRDLLKDNNAIMPVLAAEKRTRVSTTVRRGSLDRAIPDDDDE